MREKFLTFADVIIRVPLLFIIDELLRIERGLTSDNVVLDSTEHGQFKMSKVSDSIVYSMSPNSLLDPFDLEYFAYKVHFTIVLKCLCCWLGKIFNFIYCMYVIINTFNPYFCVYFLRLYIKSYLVVNFFTKV